MGEYYFILSGFSGEWIGDEESQRISDGKYERRSVFTSLLWC
jgi:hypothetical protein